MMPLTGRQSYHHRSPGGLFLLVILLSLWLNPQFSEAQQALPGGIVVGTVSGVTRSSAVVAFRTGDPGVRVQIIYHQADRNNNNALNPNHPTVKRTPQVVITRAQDDNTGHIRLTNLREDTMYMYALVVDGRIQQLPSPYTQMFRTFPSPGNDVTFSVFSDCGNNGERDDPAKPYVTGGYRGPNSNSNPLFAMQIGDFDHSNPMTLRESRSMHRRVRDTRYPAGAQLVSSILTKMSLAHIWDDHDYCDNDSDRTCTHKGAATKAFREYFPGYPQANPNYGIWYSFKAGDAEFFVVDNRSRRDPGSWPDTNSKSLLNGGGTIPNDQLNWLLQGIRSSTSTWKIIVSSTGANQYARLRTTRDNWTAYTSEAAKIKQFIRNNRINNLLMISGDIHTGGGIDDGRNSLWGIPEVTVPHTNLQQGWNIEHVGRWSEGIVSGDNSRLQGEGYVSVRLNRRALSIRVLDRDGGTKLSWSMQSAGSGGGDRRNNNNNLRRGRGTRNRNFDDHDPSRKFHLKDALTENEIAP